MNDTPDALAYVTDDNGRKIGLRKLPFIEEFRIVETLGKAAENTVYMQMVNPILLVAEIDGVAVQIPRSKREVDALIQRIDRDGYIAVMGGIAKYFSEDNKDIEARIKNAVGTQIRDRLWLVKNGVPYDRAMRMTDVDVIAHAIVFMEFENNKEGYRYNWDTGSWDKCL